MASPHSPTEATTNSARFSTYSGAPSIQPSLAPTFETSSQPSSRLSQATTSWLSPQIMSEKGRPVYGSGDPAAMASTSTFSSDDPKAQDIKSWSGALERMQDERLERQRYIMSGHKSDEVAKLALGAKVQRALSRRMVGQDATFSPKKGMESEKGSGVGVEVEAR